jgi:NADH:ubiquinone oxidoreductase subunit H
VSRWPLRVQSAIHFAIMVGTVLPALLLSGWFPLANPTDYLIVLGIFLLVGLILWVVFFLIFGVVVPRQRANHV